MLAANVRRRASRLLLPQDTDDLPFANRERLIVPWRGYGPCQSWRSCRSAGQHGSRVAQVLVKSPDETIPHNPPYYTQVRTRSATTLEISHSTASPTACNPRQRQCTCLRRPRTGTRTFRFSRVQVCAPLTLFSRWPRPRDNAPTWCRLTEKERNMRDLTTTEMEHCAGGMMQGCFARPIKRSIIVSDPQGDRDSQNPSRSDFLATTRAPVQTGFARPT